MYAAVDLGATNVRVSIGDIEGIKKRISEPTDRMNDAQGIANQIIRMIDSLKIDELFGIGVGSIGPIDISNGSIDNTPNLPFKKIPVVQPLKEFFRVPVKILNDCAAAVLGEHYFGAGKGISNLAYVTLSTGLGGGAIVDGHLLVGKDGNAVEIGHITMDPESSLVCGCGSKGHWEAYCSGRNIPHLARFLLEDRELEKSILYKLSGGSTLGFTAEILFKAAKMGDEAALEVISKIGELNAIGFANIVNVFDPELITVGGSIALNNPDQILKPINENLDKHLINRRPRIMITPLGEDIVLYGSLALILRESSHKLEKM